MIKVSKIIKQERLRRGMTQESLAKYLNTTKTTISKWENATLYPDITMLPKLAKVFNISVDDLLNYNITMTDVEIKKVSISLSKMINRTSYEEYISTVRDYYISHCNEFKFLNSLLGILANNILYCENEAQVKETTELAHEIIQTTEDNSESIYLKRHAQGYQMLMYMFEGDYSSVIDNTPDFDLKIGESATLTLAYLQKNNISKAKNVIQTDMYQSLMIFMYDFALMLTYDLYSIPIESLEPKLQHINEAFNVDYLYPHLSMNCYYKLALYYVKNDDNKAIQYLKQYCQCFDYLVADFVYQKDEFFNEIDEWLNTLPLENRLPANYENTLNIASSRILENEAFMTLDNFKSIEEDVHRIYNKGMENN
ncbi:MULTISPECIES: helix-turn-helix domain-containing protein [Staphylococcus]|uniref:helix-turn-helix domain-containing protein n=1 Tax=Staphylococcus TaxID=1279 RepID=UPI00098B1FE0|nr:helix-turn-helix transcriptional regulator [Staphylococcus hominis]MDU6506251.1 helix-turn-helix transcriptional regulator [Staphylococcus sp.]MDU6515369.1 helix-turn-helix transcriptional regulator [Staphylococcus epidermidis]MDS3856821.1 helix-turn-helix transcriptional regulator [Staphylococcus hominis]MDS3883519.1 helix-turn-helix transcriptional regulator [Staphylococcus hominis]MDS3918650.1 helix-turn-helix transcriptional regulator [Staphylococcus hominis]